MDVYDYIDEVFPKLSDEPYTSPEELRMHWLLFAELLCRIREDYMEVETADSVGFAPGLNDLFHSLIDRRKMI